MGKGWRVGAKDLLVRLKNVVLSVLSSLKRDDGGMEILSLLNT